MNSEVASVIELTCMIIINEQHPTILGTREDLYYNGSCAQIRVVELLLLSRFIPNIFMPS